MQYQDKQNRQASTAVASVLLALMGSGLSNAYAANANIGNTLYAPKIVDAHSANPVQKNAVGQKKNKYFDQTNSAPTVKWRGTRRVSVESDDKNFVLNQFHVSGSHAVEAFRHINTSSLTSESAWRSDIDTKLKIFEDKNYVTQITFGLFDTRRPIVLTKGGFGLADLDRWRTNSVIDSAVSINSKDGKFEYAAGMALAETQLQTRLSDDPALWIYEPFSSRNKIDRSSGFFQKFKAVPIQSDNAKFWVEFSHADTGQDFRNFQASNVADLYFEGSTINSVAALEVGDTSISFEKEIHDDAYFANNLNILRFAHGAIGVKATVEADELRDEGMLISANEVITARISLGISKLWSDSPKWFPDEINLGASQRSAQEATFFNSAEAVRRSFGVGLSKSGEHFTADVFVYWNERNDFSADFAFENNIEFGADVNYSIFYDDWDLSAYAIMSDLKQNRRFRRNGDERMLTGGVSFSKQFERLPDLTINVDAFSFDGDYFVDEYAFQNHDISMRFEADISDSIFGSLRQRLNTEKPLSVYVGAYRGWSLFDDIYGTSARDGETRLLLMLRRDR